MRVASLLVMLFAAVLVMAVSGFLALYSHFVPHVTVANKIAAAVFVVLIISWFTAELMYGGGDPNKR